MCWVFWLLMTIFEFFFFCLYKFRIKMFVSAMVFILLQLGEVSTGSHQRYCALCGFWVLHCFKNVEE